MSSASKEARWSVRMWLVILVVIGGVGGLAWTLEASDHVPAVERSVFALFEPGEEHLFLDALESATQAAIAACMDDAGFEYQPHYEPNQPRLGHDLSPRQFAEEYGYGVYTVDAAVFDAGATLPNPNDAIVGSLTESERSDYNVALWGDYSADPEHQTPSGCWDTAHVEVWAGGVEGRAITDQLSAIQSDLEDEIWLDAQVLTSAEAWRACMEKEGFVGVDPRAPAVTVVEYARAGGDDPAGFERRLATADVACRDDLEAAVTSARSELEVIVSVEHAQLLERYQEHFYELTHWRSG